MGCFFVALVFSGKDTRCNYFPNARVLNNIKTKASFEYSDKVKKTLTENWVNKQDIINTLTYGDVDFDQSNVPYKKGKLYIIEGKTVKNQEIILKIVNYENRAVLEEIIKK